MKWNIATNCSVRFFKSADSNNGMELTYLFTYLFMYVLIYLFLFLSSSISYVLSEAIV